MGCRKVNWYAVRMWFKSGKMFTKVFDDYEQARMFMNIMISKPRVQNAHLWEL